MDMERRVGDSWTALHVAAAEGCVEGAEVLLEACKVYEALPFGHHDVFKILREYQVQYMPPYDSTNEKENETVQKNLGGLLCHLNPVTVFQPGTFGF
uniref:Uncharacterized protein n=1 Tax=Varanus komodoensis TaxID=61221 RepID=A0A8D2J7A5_VARKO